jgi:hypothetical protein
MHKRSFQPYCSLSTPCAKMASFLNLLSRFFAGERKERLPAGKRPRCVHDRAATAERRRMLGR